MKRIVLFLLLLPSAALAQLKIADVFCSNMVLQRDKPIRFWGTGLPSTVIDIYFAGNKAQAKVKADSTWQVVFNKLKASQEPKTLIVSSANTTLTLSNILIGDVWLCLGQSNMEWPMVKEMHFKEAIKESHQPLIRLYNPSFGGKNVFGTSYSDSIVKRLTTKNFYNGSWQTCDSNSIKQMSAVGYYFGKQIVKSENIPIGLINLAIGGSPIETFISTEAMGSSKQFAAKAKGNWLLNDELPIWIRERGQQNVGSSQNVLSDALGPNHAYKPGFAYQAGIKSILPMSIKGILWYQGESNAQEQRRVEEYASLLKLLIDDYRLQWKQADLPFYWVQLSSIDTVSYKGRLWPEFRNSQRELLSIVKNGGMAVCSDVGARNDVHPTDKKTVGERLARWALNKTYGRNLTPSGPLPLSAKYSNGQVILSFQYGHGLKTSDNKTLRGISINGNTETEGKIIDNVIVLPVNEKPEYIFYAWKPFSDGNLINADFLPASTFKIKVK